MRRNPHPAKRARQSGRYAAAAETDASRVDAGFERCDSSERLPLIGMSGRCALESSPQAGRWLTLRTVPVVAVTVVPQQDGHRSSRSSTTKGPDSATSRRVSRRQRVRNSRCEQAQYREGHDLVPADRDPGESRSVEVPARRVHASSGDGVAQHQPREQHGRQHVVHRLLDSRRVYSAAKDVTKLATATPPMDAVTHYRGRCFHSRHATHTASPIPMSSHTSGVVRNPPSNVSNDAIASSLVTLDVRPSVTISTSPRKAVSVPSVTMNGLIPTFQPVNDAVD